MTRRRAPARGTDDGARGDRGSVTAELAVGLPAVVLLLVLVLAVSAAGLARARCADAARAGARAAALGGPDADPAAAARRVAGGTSEVVVVRDGEWVTVSVSAGIAPGGRVLGPVRVSASATAWVEP
ncbi:TadE family type IV pilus minor pilin [Cellulomonas fimi]|uniref:TadE family type IV pilus minor pilin n=1 Tax=Cellulomonas fimi TaxID=1708 RepID=UPI000F837034|nr:TadE family type IV pilus minor pilin [Cellulomonas fimi]NNH09127.1 TadE family protein [Cellulomonas fimi]